MKIASLWMTYSLHYTICTLTDTKPNHSHTEEGPSTSSVINSLEFELVLVVYTPINS